VKSELFSLMSLFMKEKDVCVFFISNLFLSTSYSSPEKKISTIFQKIVQAEKKLKSNVKKSLRKGVMI